MAAVLCLVRLIGRVRIMSALCEPMASCGMGSSKWYTGSRAGQGAHVGPPDPWSVTRLFISVCRGLMEAVSEHEVGRDWSCEHPGTRLIFFWCSRCLVLFSGQCMLRLSVHIDQMTLE